MKQFFSYFGASLVAIAALASCNKELGAPVEDLKGGVPFEISASAVDTKTSIDGFATSWVANDAINLFHVEAGSTTNYTSDGEFKITDETLAENKFKGTLAAKLTAESYDWYAIYPYKKQISSPGSQEDGYIYIGHSVAIYQNGNDSKAHLCGSPCPLYGVSKSIDASSPVSLEMKHLTSVVEINVTNSNNNPLTVSNITLSTDEDIVGSYYIDITGDNVVYTPSSVKTVANLNVNDGIALAKGETASFYIPIKPHVAENGSLINISVNGYKKSINLTKDVTFTAGKIKKINFNYDNTAVVKSVTFDFSDPQSLGLTKPSTSAATNITSDIVVGDVTLTTTDGGTATRIWNSKGTCDLRVYKSGGSLSFSVPDGSVITRIVFAGDAASSGYSASVGTLSSGTWTGSNQNVKFTATNNLEISTAVVTYSAGKANTSIISDDITGISARGESTAESSYTIENPIDGKTISATCDGTVVTAVTVDAGTILYDVAANTTKSAREGYIKLTYGDLTKDIKVSQLAPVFTVSSTEVELDAADNSSSTITVTSDFDWMSDASEGAGFTYDPTVCEWTDASYASAKGKITVTITASDKNASKEGTKTLGTLTFTNVETEQALVVTVTQKTSYVAPSTGKDVTFTMTKSGDFSSGTTATKDVITIAGGEGTYTGNISVGSTYTKVYSGNTLTISGTTGTKIKKVVFSATSGYIKTWSANDESECVVRTTDNTMTWNNASGVESVIFTNTASAQARVKTIVVTYE